jgi:hypothetical protein
VAGIVVLAAVVVALILILGSDNGDNAATAAGHSPGSATETDSPSREGSSSSAGPSSSSDASSGSGEIPPATVTPDGLGDEPVLEQLAQECYDGNMVSCDDLYQETKDDESYAAYTEYADTCAGRQASGTSEFCSNVFPGD